MSVSSLKYHYFGVGILNLRSMQRQTSFPVLYPTSCTCLFLSLTFCLFFSLPEKSVSILLGSCESLNTPLICHLVWEVIQSSSRPSCPCSVCTEAPSGLAGGKQCTRSNLTLKKNIHNIQCCLQTSGHLSSSE